ncbi:MAG: hypothetical protein ACTSWL_08900 [Promethearchaeota archaeon]
MARSGRKTIILPIFQIEKVEDMINFATHKSETSGLRLSIEYKHDLGIKLSIAGPKDKINLYEHQLREYLNSLQEGN